MKKFIILFLIIVVIAGCKRIRESGERTCPCLSNVKVVVIEKKIPSRHMRIYLNLINSADGTQLCKAMGKKPLENLSYQKLENLKKQLKDELTSK